MSASGVAPAWVSLSRTPGSVRCGAPKLGEHNREVYGGLLGMDEDEIAELERDGII